MRCSRRSQTVMSRIPASHRVPYLVLGAFTLVTFGGPVAMLVAVRGGPSPLWPPDRVIEWIVVGLVFALAIGLFGACVSVGWWHSGLRQTKKSTISRPGSPNQ